MLFWPARWPSIMPHRISASTPWPQGSLTPQWSSAQQENVYGKGHKKPKIIRNVRCNHTDKLANCEYESKYNSYYHKCHPKAIGLRNYSTLWRSEPIFWRIYLPKVSTTSLATSARAWEAVLTSYIVLPIIESSSDLIILKLTLLLPGNFFLGLLSIFYYYSLAATADLRKRAKTNGWDISEYCCFAFVLLLFPKMNLEVCGLMTLNQGDGRSHWFRFDLL